jgi:hypothetical protein
MKHVEIDYHFVRDRVVQKLLDVYFIGTDDQLTDGFTKALPHGQFIDLTKVMIEWKY